MPPVAPQIRTLSPCFIWAPFSLTSMRYEVELHRPLTAASSQVRCVGLGISWLALTIDEVGECAEVGLEAPDQLVRCQHRVVVRTRILIVDVVAVHGDAVAGLPVPHGRTHPQDDGGRIGADDVMGQRMALAPLVLSTHPVEEPERRKRLEDRRPHRVEVDARRHHRDVHLVGCELGCGDLVDVERLARILVPRFDAFEHRGLVAFDERGPIALGNREIGELVAAGTCLDGFENLLHAQTLPIGNRTYQGDETPRNVTGG